MSGKKPDVARVALDTQRMKEMTVGVGVGNMPHIVPVRRGLVISDESQLLTKLEQTLPADQRLVVACFQGEGTCTLVQDAHGGVRWFLGVGLSTRVCDYTIDIFGSTPRDHA